MYDAKLSSTTQPSGQTFADLRVSRLPTDNALPVAARLSFLETTTLTRIHFYSLVYLSVVFLFVVVFRRKGSSIVQKGCP